MNASTQLLNYQNFSSYVVGISFESSNRVEVKIATVLVMYNVYTL